METDPRSGCDLPDSICEAVSRGWRGLAASRAGGPGPVTLACVVPGRRIDLLAPGGLAIGLPARAPVERTDRPRRVALALASDPGVALTLDLAFADARAMVGRIGEASELRLLWARAEDAAVVRSDRVAVSAETAARMRLEAALNGEWQVEDPRPAGFSRLGWWREAAAHRGPRLVRGDLAGAGVAVLAPILRPGLRLPDPPRRPPDIELGFPCGPPVPEADARLAIHLDGPRQLALAADLAEQRQVGILLVDPLAGGEWVAHVQVELGRRSRAVIAQAAREAA